LLGKTPEACFRALIVADTRDYMIGNTCDSDVYRLKKSLQTIASHVKMPLELEILDDKKCSGYHLKRWIKHQRISENDLVLLYYSGHGNKDPLGGPWPVLSLRDDSLHSDGLVDSIRSLPCRFSMVVLDCCNGDGTGVRSAHDHYMPIIKDNKSWHGFKPLFLHFKGFIAVSAATRYEPACCAGEEEDKIWGGFLTTGILKGLKEFGQNSDATWDQVLNKAKNYSMCKSNYEQHPFFTIERR
jgi:hypothetical protein